MIYKKERMSFPDLCTAAHLLTRYPFPENVSAVYRDLGYGSVSGRRDLYRKT